MAIIPLRQTITVYKKTGLDEWGNPIESPPITLKCRVDESSHTTSDVQAMQRGKVLVPEVRILLDKLADIGYDDEIEFTDENGRTIRKKPIRINVKRDFFGKPLLTEVLL